MSGIYQAYTGHIRSVYTMYILGYTWYIHCHVYTWYILGYTMYIPSIWMTFPYGWYIPGIYQVYTKNRGSRWTQPEPAPPGRPCDSPGFSSLRPHSVAPAAAPPLRHESWPRRRGRGGPHDSGRDSVDLSHSPAAAHT